MNTEDGAKLYDVCPHVSDSVRWLHPRSLGGGVGGTSPVSSALGSTEGAWLLGRVWGLGPGRPAVSASAFLEGGAVWQKVKALVFAGSSRTFFAYL